MISYRVFLTFLFSFLFTAQAGAVELQLKKQGGVYILPVRINGVITLNFTLDSGASEVVIPADVALTLVRAGTINDRDFLNGQTYKLADGSTLKSARFVIRELELGGIKIPNVPCSVVPIAGDLLLGQSLLGRLDSWTLDNKANKLIIGNRTASASGASAKTFDEMLDEVLGDNKPEGERGTKLDNTVETKTLPNIPQSQNKNSPQGEMPYKKGFDRAAHFIQQGKLEAARREYWALISHNPKSEFVDSALFAIAECYLIEKRYQDAIETYQQVIDKYPSSSKAPLALLKQGVAFQETGDVTAARIIYGRVLERYPGSPAARAAKNYNRIIE